MILAVASLVVAVSPDASVAEAARALASGRPEQARVMIRAAVAQGAAGAQVDRLLADLAFAEKRWTEASVRYGALLAGNSEDPALLEQAGIAALYDGKPPAAIALLDRALRRDPQRWRSWNARGVAADRQGDWTAADRAYAAGLAEQPQSALLLNNLGWSLMLRGRWAQAAQALARAAAAAPADTRIAANLELARAATSEDLPQRTPGEGNIDYARRLNDAGVVALRQGNPAKAAAAFAQALQASDRWFTRAANNLALAESSVR